MAIRPLEIPDVKDKRNCPFHDSSLIDIKINSRLTRISVVVSTPDEHRRERLWLIEFTDVLRFEYQTLGEGTEESETPLEVYDIYNRGESEERQWWVDRLKFLGVSPAEAEKVHHIVLASSFMRGVGKRDYLDGLQIICRGAKVSPAPGEYKGMEFSRPWIPAGDDD